MMQSQGGLPFAEVARVSETQLSATQKQIVDRMLSRYDTTGLSRGEAVALMNDIDDIGVQPVREATRAGEVAAAARDKPKIARNSPGWPDSPRVLTLATIVQELLANTDDIPPEEDFTTQLLQKLEEAGLDTTKPIVDFYA
ncbi:hypothetical protein [Pseudooceanicola onchidii]|uniref:hypothetical protein n=1 Tax=Pseudooceanicola onchidii TaxID=2562279 RepID=UPI0010AA895C|nr:hypothetical protein [Pseudooceanicola onchidii]